MADMQQQLRALPGVDALLHSQAAETMALVHGREPTLDALRRALAEARSAILEGGLTPDQDSLLARAAALVEQALQPSLRPVINATGVILHTNLGRAPLSTAVVAAMRQVAEGYSNLEYDLDAGHRGSRYLHAEGLLCRLTGAEAALVVNNNAGAVLLALSALARDAEVVISRGQLVEIGGGFRIPDVMAQSGARLVEVGTTNRTYIRDYAAAITESTVALMRVHTSNFRVQGFAYQPEAAELADLAHTRSLLLLDDLGSGTLLDTARYGLRHEPTVQEALAAGADLVMFSGDKLLGGPQAGLLVGRSSLIERLRAHPLTRALRVDKATLAGVQANLMHYLRGEAEREVPIWRMMALAPERLAVEAQNVLDGLGHLSDGCELISGRSMIGGGSLPEESLPTTLLALPTAGADVIAAALRRGDPPVVARIEDGRVVLDLRTVAPDEVCHLARRLEQVLSPSD
ncbi:MAG: L-seryl-tRNA(Sec) selenium transferase [Anaerolineae bacterium]